MEDSKDFGNVDLEGVRISTLLEEANDEKEKEIKSTSNNSEIKNKENSNEEIINNKYEKQKKKIIDKSYDNYIHVYAVFLIQSLISFGYYFLFYKLKFQDNGIKIRMCLLVSLFLLIICICYLSRAQFYSRFEKISNIYLYQWLNQYY